MSSLPDPLPRVSSDPAPPDPVSVPLSPWPILDVRLTVRPPHGGARRNAFVRIERTADDPDEALFVKAVREYRHRHGSVMQIVAIDLHPGT
jgi:hypothetical protein